MSWLFASLGLVLVVIAIGLLRMLEKTQLLRNLTQFGFFLLLLLGWGLPSVAGWWFVLTRQGVCEIEPSCSLFQAFGIVWTVGIIVLAFQVGRARWFSSVSTLRYLGFALGAGVLIKLVYLGVLDIRSKSDFALMWALAGEVVSGGWPTTHEAIGAMGLTKFGPIYEELTLAVRIPLTRTIPYFLPLQWLFGSDRIVFELANLVSFVLTALMAFDLMRRWVGEAPARGALLLILVSPETTFAGAITTHDIPSTLFAVGVFWALDRLLDCWNSARPAALVWSAGLGFAVTALQVQRGTGPLFFLSAVLYGLVVVSRETSWDLAKLRGQFGVALRWVVLVLVLPWGISTAVTSTLSQKGWGLSEAESEQAFITSFAAQTDPYGNGTYHYRNKRYLVEYGGYSDAGAVSAERWRELVVDRFWTDWHNDPLEFASMAYRKSLRLFNLGSQREYYYGHKIIEEGSLLTGPPVTRFLAAQNRAFVLFFIPLMLVSMVIGVWTGRFNVRLWPAVGFLSLQSLILIAIGEIQPRYMYGIWFLGPLLFAAALPRSEASKEVRLRTGAVAAFSICLLGLALLACAALTEFAERRTNRFLDFTSWQPQRVGTGTSSWAVMQDPNREGRLRNRLRLTFNGSPAPGDRITARGRIESIAADSVDLRTFIFSRKMKGENVAKLSKFKGEIYAQGRRVAEFALDPESLAREIVVRDLVPVEGALALDFVLRAPDEAGPGGGLPRASVVFEFAQLLERD